MFRFLSKGSRTFDDIDSALKTALQAKWKSKNQTGFRLSWLRSLGQIGPISRHGEGARLRTLENQAFHSPHYTRFEDHKLLVA